MPDTIEQLLSKANRDAERAYWWLKDIDVESARALGVAERLQAVLALLQRVDHLTVDILITLKQPTGNEHRSR